MNDDARISIKQDGANEVNHLIKKDDFWQVRERNDYPANFPAQISEFLIKAARPEGRAD